MITGLYCHLLGLGVLFIPITHPHVYATQKVLVEFELNVTLRRDILIKTLTVILNQYCFGSL